MKLVMLVGLPASGKSTYAKKLSEEINAVIHSSDALREELHIDDNDLIFKELHTRIINDLTDGKSVIYDATNINYKRRKAFLDTIRNIDCEKICVLIATPYEKCIKNNESRERKVPEQVIKRMYHNFYIPQYYEGWNHIRIIRNIDDIGAYCNIWGKMIHFKQDNPHHTLTLGEHCRNCCEILFKAENVSEDAMPILLDAAYLHDIGKLKTKSFTNSKGETTTEAHYYQHHLVGAYDAIFCLFETFCPSDIVLQICNYIQWHMHPYFLETEKAKQKFINLVGQEFYDNLMILHKADKEAH